MTCQKDGGFCLFGCIDGYKGDKCDLQESIQHGTGSCFSLVVGASIASACLTSVMILVIVLLRRKCKHQRDKPNKHNKSNVKRNGNEETALVCIEPTTNQSDNAVPAYSDDNNTPGKVNDVATVYESLTISGTDVRQTARLCSTDYTSLEVCFPSYRKTV
ncbi:uncharacterized protein LOC132718936 isoform X2 [Ruditapes philippinarum]|uniref:uncharacterized protein LOC132718936 isoform X2 n=1 Tax=Ruditapes philippinarum TaxID=129788 RepID=UPI00295AE264|nr:uncharacterized protein LOC132718936 isoform X2 [Ruditapes philippinarum]